MRRVLLGLLLAAACGCSNECMVRNAEREAMLYGPPPNVSQKFLP